MPTPAFWREPRWRALFVLSVARIAMGFQFQAIATVAPGLQERFGIDLAGIGWLVGLYLLPGIALALPSGMLGARFGDKRIAAAGLALMVLGGVVMAVADDPATLATGRLICGAGGVAFNVIVQKMVADWFAGREIVLAMSIIINTWPVGIALSLFTLGGVATAYGPAAAFALTAAFSLFGLVLLLAAYRPSAEAAVAPRPDLGAISRREWGLLGLAGSAWMLFNVVFAAGLSTFLPVFLIERGIEAGQARALVGLNSLVVVFSVVAGGALIQRLQRPQLVAQSGLLGTATVLATMLTSDLYAVWVPLAGLLAGLAAGPIASLPAQFLRPETRSTGMGVSLTIFYVGMALLPGPMGAIATRFGTTDAVVVTCIIMTVAVALLVALVAVLRSRPPPALATAGTAD